MARKKMHNVTAQKSNKDKMRITISKEDMLTMDRAARRQADIDAGRTLPGGVRGGVHGGGKHERNKRDRRDAREDLRHSKGGDE